MNSEQQRRYVALNNKAIQGIITPPEEVELNALGNLLVKEAYNMIPSEVRKEIEEYLEKGDSNTTEFYQGVIHAVSWIFETTRYVKEEELPAAIEIGLSLLSLSACSKVQELRESIRQRLTDTLKLEVNPDNTNEVD